MRKLRAERRGTCPAENLIETSNTGFACTSVQLQSLQSFDLMKLKTQASSHMYNFKIFNVELRDFPVFTIYFSVSCFAGQKPISEGKNRGKSNGAFQRKMNEN